MAMALSQLPPWLWRNTSSGGGGASMNSSEQQQSQQQNQQQEDQGFVATRAKSRRARQQQQRHKSSSRACSSSSSTSSGSSNSRPWMICKERQVDEEFDMVVVPSDGCCVSGSESEDSDWSVGWLEPHSADFSSDSEDSFAVLVPCYGSSSPRLATLASPSNNHVWAAALLSTLSARNAAAEQRKHVEDWLSSLQQQ